MRIVALILTLSAISTFAYGQQNGLDFLNIAPTASLLGNADAGTASATGAAAIHFNPALLSYDNSNTLDLGYTRWIEQTNLFGGLNSRKGSRSFAFSIYNASIDGIEQRDRPGPANGTFEISYFSIAAAYSYDLKIFSLGAAAQYLNENNFTERASGYAFNFGIARNFANRITLGASLLNLGEMDKLINQRSQIPSQFRTGALIRIDELKLPGKNEFFFKSRLMVDYVYQLEEFDNIGTANINTNQGYLNIGTTFEIAEVIELQTGYRTGDSSRSIQFGAGVITEEIKFNYAIIPFDSGFGTAHSIGIQYYF